MTASCLTPAQELCITRNKAVTVRLTRWLRRELYTYANHSVDLLDEPATAIEILADTPSPRPLGFLLDPIIAHALMGQKLLRLKYPPLSTANVFAQKGFTFDPHAIAHEFRRNLFDGKVQVSKRDVCRGEGDRLSFSPALHSNLVNSLSEAKRSMLQEYRIFRVHAEFSSHPAALRSDTMRQMTSNLETLELIQLASSKVPFNLGTLQFSFSI